MCLRAASGRARSQIPSSNRMRLQSSADDSGAKPWREHEHSATGPERVSHTLPGCKELAALHAEFGGTMIYVTHDQTIAATEDTCRPR